MFLASKKISVPIALKKSIQSTQILVIPFGF